MGDSESEIPDFGIKLTSEEVTAKPRMLKHRDGSPMLWPDCLEGKCKTCEAARAAGEPAPVEDNDG